MKKLKIRPIERIIVMVELKKRRVAVELLETLIVKSIIIGYLIGYLIGMIVGISF